VVSNAIAAAKGYERRHAADPGYETTLARDEARRQPLSGAEHARL
jgi:hypothetical protein